MKSIVLIVAIDHSGARSCCNYDDRIVSLTMTDCNYPSSLDYPYSLFSNFVSDLELVCLASWSDGSDTYMFGKFNGPGFDGKDKMYRCFVSITLHHNFLLYHYMVLSGK